MNKRPFPFYFLLTAAAIARLYAGEYSVSTLLSGYLENDVSLQKLSSQVKYAELDGDISSISNGWSISLETGTVTFTTGENGGIKFTPQASLDLPFASGISLDLESTVTYSEGSVSAKDSSLSLSAGIISGTYLTRQIEKMKAERSILEARRNLQDGFVSSEQSFYSELKELYAAASSLVASELDLYEDRISLDEVIASGYSTASAKYRTASLTVTTDEYNVEKYQHELDRQTKVFLSECGITDDVKDALSILPDDIPEAEAVRITDFARENYTKTESAVWTHNINTLVRKADYFCTLSASAGYTKDNSDTDSDSIDAGTTLSLNNTGLVLGAGVSFPVFTDGFTPAYTLSVSIDPNALRTYPLEKKQSEIEDYQETLDIKEAESDYETDVISQEATLADLIWEEKSDEEYLSLYQQMVEDYASYLEKGIITESEYRQAETNLQKYRLQKMTDRIEKLIYNADTKLLFTRDEELINE